MKKLFTLLATVALLCAAVPQASAAVISPQLAKSTADNLLSLDSDFAGAGDATVSAVEENGIPVYYLVEYNAGGWAIIAAQSAARPLIAYNPTGAFEAPQPMQDVLAVNRTRIASLATTCGETYHPQWSMAQQRKPAADPGQTNDIAPLITVHLNQSAPYNSMCPTVGGERCLVGCVAVGMAQAMMVARYPEHPVGQYSYTDSGTGYHSIDFDAEAPYDWDAMYAASSTNDYSEIARLLYHCGVSVNMQYGVDGSGAYTVQVATALPRNFQYDRDLVRHVDKPSSRDEWIALLLDELVLGRVVVYHGSSDDSGHCWNIDGWRKATQMFHVDWGWGGYGNAYFDIESMQDSYQGLNFPYNNGVVIGVGAPTTAPYGMELSRTRFSAGTVAGEALADVTVRCEDAEAQFEFTIQGPEGIIGRVKSPYTIENMKLVSTETVTDANKFKSALIKVTNAHTGEAYEKEFFFTIDNSAVKSLYNDAMRVYPTVATDVVTLEVPAAGGEYALYNLAGKQVAAGNIHGYTTQISVKSLPAGTYLLKFIHNNGVGVKTVIVK